MKVSSAKENILKKIRQALTNSTPLPFPHSEGNSSVFKASSQGLDIEFAERFTHLLGKFVFCADEQELVSQLNELTTRLQWQHLYCKETSIQKLLNQYNFKGVFSGDLANCDAAITGCELLVARTGSIVMSTAQQSGRTTSVYAPVHICIAYANQLVYDVRDGLQLLKEKYAGKFPSLITFATGPSRTADIEKTLVVGVHGPKEVYTFLVDQPKQ